MAKNIILSPLQQLNARTPKHKNLVSVSAEATLQEVLETLDKNDVFSAPVHKTNSDNVFMGIASRTDILTTFLFPHRGMNTNQVPKEQDFVWPKLEEPVSSVLRVSAESASAASGLVPFVFQDSDVLPQLLEAFSSGWHRVLVQSAQGFRMVTQSDVAAFLLENINHLEALKNEKVSSFMSKQVKALSPSLSTFTAFRELLIEEVTAAPVIDKNGRLIGTLSLSDSRGMFRQSSAKDLFVPVWDFVTQQGRYPTVVVGKTDTFATALRKLVQNRVQHAWVMEHGELIGVVSLTDICTCVFASPLVSELYGEYSRTQLNLLRTPLSLLVSDKKEASIVNSDTPQREVLELLAKNRALAVPVQGKDGLAGLASLYDIFSLLLLDSKLDGKVKDEDVSVKEYAKSENQDFHDNITLNFKDEPVQESVQQMIPSKEQETFDDQEPQTETPQGSTSTDRRASTKSVPFVCVCKKKSARRGSTKAHHTRRCRRTMLAAKSASKPAAKPQPKSNSKKGTKSWKPVPKRVSKSTARRSSLPTSKDMAEKKAVVAPRRASVPAKIPSVADTLMDLWKESSQQPVGNTIVSHESSICLVLDENERLSKVLDAFSQGYHRLLISSLQDSNDFRMLSQFDVVSYFHQVVDRLGEVAKKPASSVVTIDGKLLKTVSSKQSCLSAFRKLFIMNLNAAPVIDSYGEAVGTLSITDLRGLGSEEIGDLLLTVEEFLQKRNGGVMPPAIIVPNTESLASIIDTVTRNHIHRVWIAGDDGKPVGVLSLTDIITTVLVDRLQLE